MSDSGTCRTDCSSTQTNHKLWWPACPVSCELWPQQCQPSIAGINLPIADEMKVLGVVLDRCKAFDRHALAVARSCNYHVQAICHIRHLLTNELAQTSAYSLVLSRIDYCNALLHGAPTGNINIFQQVQNNAAWIVLHAPRQSHTKSLLYQLHWLPVQQQISYKLAMWTFKVHTISMPSYLSWHITSRGTVQTRVHGRRQKLKRQKVKTQRWKGRNSNGRKIKRQKSQKAESQ